jgi:hypothetical protein
MGATRIRKRLGIAVPLLAMYDAPRAQCVAMRIRTIQLNRTRGRPHGFLKGMLPIRRPPKEQSMPMIPRKRVQCCHAVRVDCQRLFGFANRLFENRSILLVLCLTQMCPRPKGHFVSAEMAGARAGSLQLLGSLDLWCDRGDNGSGYLFLHCEDVFQHAVIAFRPDVIAGQRVDQLAGHAY